jgi:tRNA pseudouridine55 synthase
MQGILLIDKPSGWTSFDVVNYVRKIVADVEMKKPKNVKVGHTGTLDPLATGLLVLLIGKEYTRRAGELSKHDKTYEVTMELGEVSTTGDEEGQKTVFGSTEPAKDEITAALMHFTGEIMQTPPIFSAMKVGGVRAYKLAREGKPVVLASRPVKIYRTLLTDYSYPHVSFTTQVSSGTYVRSLVTDLGELLNTGAYMSSLRRTQVGEFLLTDAQSVESLNQANLADLIAEQ